MVDQDQAADSRRQPLEAVKSPPIARFHLALVDLAPIEHNGEVEIIGDEHT